MKSDEYEYSSGNLLEDRNTYFYTEFRGKAFLAAWRNMRNAAIDSPQQSTTVDFDQSPVLQLLDELYRKISNRDAALADALQILLRLCQRFEVTKRLHGEYGNDWRPLNLYDYKKLERYVRFAEVLSLAYGATDRLPFLNTMLKCMDTLTSMSNRLNRKQKERLRKLVLEEQFHIQALCQRL